MKFFLKKKINGCCEILQSLTQNSRKREKKVKYNQTKKNFTTLAAQGGRS